MSKTNAIYIFNKPGVMQNVETAESWSWNKHNALIHPLSFITTSLKPLTASIKQKDHERHMGPRSQEVTLCILMCLTTYLGGNKTCQWNRAIRSTHSQFLSTSFSLSLSLTFFYTTFSTPLMRADRRQTYVMLEHFPINILTVSH